MLLLIYLKFSGPLKQTVIEKQFFDCEFHDMRKIYTSSLYHEEEIGMSYNLTARIR